MANGMEKIVAEVVAFLRAGGHVTWTEWRKLSTDYRAAFIVARKQIDIEAEIVRRASAIDLYAELDGGELADELSLVNAVERLARG